MKKLKRFTTIFFIFLLFSAVSCDKSAVTLPEKEDKTSVTDADSGKEIQDNDESEDTDFVKEIQDEDTGSDVDEEEPSDYDNNQICFPGDKRCNDIANTVEQCDGTGRSWETVESCLETQYCDGDSFTCEDYLCTPGAFRCSETTNDVEQCAADGLSWSVSEDCTETQYCDDTADPIACADQVCVPGEKSCDGDNVVVCNEEGSGTEVSKECNSPEICYEQNTSCMLKEELTNKHTGVALTSDAVRCNAYKMTRDTTLYSFAMMMDIDDSAGNIDVTYLIYSESEGGTFAIDEKETVSLSSDGKKYYYSPNFNALFNNSEIYLLCIALEDTATLYYNNNEGPFQLSFADVVGFKNFNGLPVPDSIDYKASDTAYLQEIVVFPAN